MSTVHTQKNGWNISFQLYFYRNKKKCKKYALKFDK